MIVRCVVLTMVLCAGCERAASLPNVSVPNGSLPNASGPSVSVASVSPSGPLRVDGAWARPADSGATGGVYLTLVNVDSITVHIAGFTSSAARQVEAHETMMHGDVARMDQRAELQLLPGATLTMKPGGTHVMLTDLTRALRVGDSVPLTLRLRDGRTVTVQARVQAP